MMFLAMLAVATWGGALTRDQPEDAAVICLAEVQREQEAARLADDPRSRAEHLYRRTDAADRCADALNHEPADRAAADWLAPGKHVPETAQEGDTTAFRDATRAQVDGANQYGANLQWCEVNGDWTARVDGYLDYLSLWQEGPDAEEAWWRGKLRHTRTNCFDAEGSEEETAEFVNEYAEFLRHFPAGQHAIEAGELLKAFQENLADYRKQGNR